MTKPLEFLSVGEIAEELGKTRQAIQFRFQEGKLPAPDATTRSRPLWRRSTLERAGVLKQGPRK